MTTAYKRLINAAFIAVMFVAVLEVVSIGWMIFDLGQSMRGRHECAERSCSTGEPLWVGMEHCICVEKAR